jgi:GT2 family glycosyltransferase
LELVLIAIGKNMKKKLTIVIVTFESSEIIKSCLEKINFDKYDAFVVDNNSQDGTTDIVSRDFPQANLIKLDQNIGFGRANNLALNKAQTDYSLILNPDAFMLEVDIDKALQILDDNKQFALASPRTLHQKDISDLKNIHQDSQKERGSEPISNTDFVVGGVMFMRMEIFKKIGFFDERIFMFCEDNEISARSIDAGYKNAIINNSIAFHVGGSSSRKSLRTTYRRFWHLGWSKSYWKSRRKSWINVKRSTLRLIILHFFEFVIYSARLNKEKAVSKIAFAAGCSASLVGLKPFKRNGAARG